MGVGIGPRRRSEWLLCSGIAFSAILEDRGLPTERIHKRKLDTVVGILPAVFQNAGATQADIEAFYRKWLETRYSNVAVTPREGVDFLRLPNRLIDAIILELATKAGESVADVENNLSERILGSANPQVDQAISDVHDALQFDLEVLGEEGDNSKLGMKLTNASNFCQVLALGGDPVTQKVVGESERIAERVANLYRDFVSLIDHIQMARMSAGVDNNDLTNFSFFVRLGYHGLSIPEMYEEFRAMVEASRSEPRELPPDQEDAISGSGSA